MSQKTINKTEFDRLARLGSKAALDPYERTKQILIAENLRAQKLNRPFSFFIKAPEIKPAQIVASTHYQAFKQGEVHIKLKNIFLYNLFEILNALDENDDASLHGVRWDSIQHMYDEICQSNPGDKPIFDVFRSGLLSVLDNPKIHENFTTLKKASTGMMCLCVAMMLSAAIMSAMVSFSVISPILLCTYVVGFLGVALQITDNVVRFFDESNDEKLIPVNNVYPVEVLNACEYEHRNNQQIIGQAISFI